LQIYQKKTLFISMQSKKIEQNQHIRAFFTHDEEISIYFTILEILTLDVTIIYDVMDYRIANRYLRSYRMFTI